CPKISGKLPSMLSTCRAKRPAPGLWPIAGRNARGSSSAICGLSARNPLPNERKHRMSSAAEMDHAAGAAGRDRARKRLQGAVRRSPLLSRRGFSERLFAHLFNSLVYPQIWEDPEVDMAALDIGLGHRVVTIASGGCNALSYLVAG